MRILNTEYADKLRRSLCEEPAYAPVSFYIGDTKHKGLGDFNLIYEKKSTDNNGMNFISRGFDGGGFIITLDTAHCPEYGEFEYTLGFVNNSDKDTPPIHNLLSADISLDCINPIMEGILGDHENQYKPYRKELSREEVAFVSLSGRPTHVVFPYFHIRDNKSGVLCALGWGGTWSANFAFSEGKATIKAEANVGFSSVLHPGESARGALVVLLPYSNLTEDEATNLWRSWFVKYNLPKDNGKPLMPLSTTNIAYDTGLPNSDGSISERYFTWKPSIDKILEKEVPIDFRWLDAGWYTDPRGRTVFSDWWGTVGSWELDREKWKDNSLRESVDYCHEHGIKTVVWFEPERVTDVEGLSLNYGYDPAWGISDGGSVITNNIGNEECLKWTGDRIIKMMDENDIDMYREDNNSDPAVAWRIGDEREAMNCDKPRAGISENKAVVGHYKLWDRIIRYCAETGKCTFVDSCASGGGRNDIESMRRGFPLLRSDSDRTSISLRLSMTASFNKWIPFCGAATNEAKDELIDNGFRDRYTFRASYLPALNIRAEWVQDKNLDFELIKDGIKEWESINELLLSDMYVLTRWHSEKERSEWSAFAYYDEDKGKGVLLAFRMEDCPVEEYIAKLPFATEGYYQITNVDNCEMYELSAEQLRDGIKLSADEPRSSVMLMIEKL